MILIERADAFAFGAHGSIGQRRNYTGAPYIEHPRAVATIMSTIGAPDHAIAAALLHDTREDVHWVTDELIRNLFGSEVADLVAEVTDISRPSDGNRAVRKAIDRAHLAKASPMGQTLKVADLLHNRRTIFEHAPKFAMVYVGEMNALLDVLTSADPRLMQMLRSMELPASLAA